jgi:D-serine deaminase-like pyridoxal phosphate-dependent protein
LGEAEALVGGGVRDVLIANQVVGKKKLARLVHLNAWADVKVAVDNDVAARQLSEAAVKAGVQVGVLIEVEVGNKRAGVQTPAQAAELASTLVELPGLEFRGLMGYEGHAVLIPDRARRESLAREAMCHLMDCVEAVRSAGIEVELVSGGGTGTFDITGQFEGITEVQAGSYFLMDARYGQLEDLPFEHALTLLATVTSRPTPERAVTDAGRKALSIDFGLPEAHGVEGIETLSLSEEHGKLKLAEEAQGLSVGDKLHFLPTHVCTNMDLHDRAYGIRDGRVETIIEVAARGKFR